MSKKNGLEVLNDEIAIPEIVQQRAQEAFDQIYREAEWEEQKIMMLSDEREAKKQRYQNAENGREFSENGKRRTTRRTAVAVILAGVLVLGTMTIAAAVFRGPLVDSLKEMFHISDEHEEELLNREDGLVQIIESEYRPADSEVDIFGTEGDVTSVTCNGVTVTLTQAMVDPFYVCMALKAEGIPNGETRDVFFEYVRMKILGAEEQKSFWRSMKSNEPGTMDSNFALRPANGSSREDSVPGWFLGKQLEITLTNIQGILNPEVSEEEETLIEGQWVLTWTIQGTEEIHTYDVNQTLGNTGVTVERITFSPLSIEVCYDTPRKVIEYEGEYIDLGKNPPEFMGVLLKDGTIMTGLTNIIEAGYDSADSMRYIFTSKMYYLLDIEEIDSVLFKKKFYGPDEARDHEYVLDDFYVIPLAE